MPEVSRFYGIVIHIYYGDHAPPHFHAQYAGAVAQIAVDSLQIFEGSLPKRALGLVLDWAAAHQPELRVAFARAADLQSPGRIAPLE